MLRLEPRPQPSRLMFYATPLLAILLTLGAGAVLFAVLGKPPLEALALIFITPLTSLRGIAELTVKATPLILIAIGLAAGFRAGVWNIGAEGGSSRSARWPAAASPSRSTRLPAGGCFR